MEVMLNVLQKYHFTIQF